MKLMWVILLNLFAAIMIGQDQGSVPILISSDQDHTTRAVIFGVSNYLSEDITDLRFAHKDADAFVLYLQSDIGGSLTSEQMQLYTNEQATLAQIYDAFNWLYNESQDGDLAIFYFSGHSDTELTWGLNEGYILPYDSPPKSYQNNALPMVRFQGWMQQMISKSVRLIIITDACHSGKLAGNSVNGASFATASIATRFKNEIRILSCQPDEFSKEGPQWGGGRGVFSYYLLEGLTGKADRNQDLQVSVMEIRRFLEDVVPAEVEPEQQIPVTLGDNLTVLAKLNPEASDKDLSDDPIELKVNDAALEERVLSETSAAIKFLYNSFNTTLEKGQLMSPKGDCANDYYELLLKEESIKELHDVMRRKLAVALQDQMQLDRNALID